MKVLFSVLVISLLIGCSVQKNSELPFEFELLAYGVLSSEKSVAFQDDENRSPSGNTVLQKKLTVIEVTDSIMGEKGVIFGIQFIVHCKEDFIIPIKRIWTFPEKIKMTNGDLTKNLIRTDRIPTNRPLWMYYTVEDDNEIALGKWTIQYFVNDVNMLSKSFIMK